MNPKRLVLFVEGQGDEEAVPILVNKLLKEINPWEYLSLDYKSFRVGGVERLTGKNIGEWIRYLRIANKRKNLGGILLLVDGDRETVINEETEIKENFCAAKVACRLAERARQAGGGTLFSVACVFACREYESWLLAGIESLKWIKLPDERPGIKEYLILDGRDTNKHPRDAKKFLSENMPRGYKSTTDQKILTEMVDLNAIRRTNPRSFRRFENAVKQLCEAIRTNSHIVSPIG